MNRIVSDEYLVEFREGLEENLILFTERRPLVQGVRKLKKSTIGLIVVAAVITVVTFFSERMVFPPVDVPPVSLLPAFIFLGVWDALAFGIGIALLIYVAVNYSKWPKAIRVPVLVLFLIALWFSIPNWIHDGLHEAGASPPNWALLAAVEYTFHFPWLIIAGILAVVALRMARAYSAK